MEKITVNPGDSLVCPRCMIEFSIETAEKTLGPVRPAGLYDRDSDYLYLPTHSWTDMTSLPCSGSRARVTEPSRTGVFVLAVAFNPGRVGGVSYCEVMSILEDADLDIYNDYGTDRVEFSNREELAERVMKLFASKEGSTTS